MSKMIANFINNKWGENNKTTDRINQIQISLLMSILDTPEKTVSNIDWEADKRKICTSLIKSSSKIFSCLIRAIYNRVHCAQNKRLMLKSFIPAINTSIVPKKYMKISFLKNVSINYIPGLKITFI